MLCVFAVFVVPVEVYQGTTTTIVINIAIEQYVNFRNKGDRVGNTGEAELVGN